MASVMIFDTNSCRGEHDLATPAANKEAFRQAKAAGFDPKKWIFEWNRAPPYYYPELIAEHQDVLFERFKTPTTPLPEPDVGYWWFRTGKHDFVQRPAVLLDDVFTGEAFFVRVLVNAP
jgi:hypothetical protein